MDVGCQGLALHVHERSRAQAAKGLGASVQSRMAGANVAREAERGTRCKDILTINIIRTYERDSPASAR